MKENVEFTVWSHDCCGFVMRVSENAPVSHNRTSHAATEKKMQRRLFFKTSAGWLLAGAGAQLIPNAAAAQAPSASGPANVVCSFGWVTDVHHVRKPESVWDEEGQAHREVFGDALGKLREAVKTISARRPDFLVDLGDLKDCTDSGTAEETGALLAEAVAELHRFDGPVFHTPGNHDFDRITPERYARGIGAADASRLYHAFTMGGVRFIVLDACYNTPEGEHYSAGNFKWSVSMLPKAQLGWLRRELASGTEPAVVFVHQLLNHWDSSARGGVIPDGYFLRNADEVVRALEESGRVLAVFTGHYHLGFTSVRSGIRYVTGRGMVENPAPRSAFGIVRIDSEGGLWIEGFGDEPSRSLC